MAAGTVHAASSHTHQARSTQRTTPRRCRAINSAHTAVWLRQRLRTRYKPGAVDIARAAANPRAHLGASRGAAPPPRSASLHRTSCLCDLPRSRACPATRWSRRSRSGRRWLPRHARPHGRASSVPYVKRAGAQDFAALDAWLLQQPWFQHIVVAPPRRPSPLSACDSRPPPPPSPSPAHGPTSALPRRCTTASRAPAAAPKCKRAISFRKCTSSPCHLH